MDLRYNAGRSIRHTTQAVLEAALVVAIAGALAFGVAVVGGSDPAGAGTVAAGGNVSGNARGLDYDGYKALGSETLASERKRIHAMFESSRPHYMIDTITDLPEVIADINKRLANGEMPQSF